MDCNELVELVTAYLDDALGPDERRWFDQHLATCTGCRRHLEQMRRTIDLTGRLSTEDVSPTVMERLLEAFRAGPI